MDQTAQGFEDSREEQESLAIENGFPDFNKSEIIEIN